jgi:hypothetical protein
VGNLERNMQIQPHSPEVYGGFIHTSARLPQDGFLDLIDPPHTRGRTMFAVDATASRQPTWDLAARLWKMFTGRGCGGSLDIQLVYHGGWGECVASRWFSDARSLASIISGVMYRAGDTQIRRVLNHARKEHQRQKVNALILILDDCEEIPADRYDGASELALPVFLFQQKVDPGVIEVAKITLAAQKTETAYLLLTQINGAR